jgi:hypothetical protein
MIAQPEVGDETDGLPSSLSLMDRRNEPPDVAALIAGDDETLKLRVRKIVQ